MTNFDTSSSQTNLPFISKIMILVGLTLVFMTIGSVIGFFFFTQMTGMPFAQIADFQKHLNDYPNMYDANLFNANSIHGSLILFLDCH
jgi:hypothetical protein